MDQVSVAEDRLLTLDEAYRATFHFIAQYYEREPIEPLLLMLHSVTAEPGGGSPRETSDPATWDDWIKSVSLAVSASAPLELPGADSA